jgi:hypothetical protein
MQWKKISKEKVRNLATLAAAFPIPNIYHPSAKEEHHRIKPYLYISEVARTEYNSQQKSQLVHHMSTSTINNQALPLPLALKKL